MSIEQAKEYIRRLRREKTLRQQFELVWQAKWRQPDKKFITKGTPLVPNPLDLPCPDSKADFEGYRAWWAIHRAQRDMHQLICSEGDGRDHTQEYADGDTITDARIESVIGQPEMEANLELLAQLATLSTGQNISLADMKAAWHGYVRWVYALSDASLGSHPEVRRLRNDVSKDTDLLKGINEAVKCESMSLGAALALQGYLLSGFTAESSYESFDRHKAWLEEVAQIASEAGYEFSGLDYLNDCIHQQWMNDPGPELGDKYWPEDDPNRWTYEAPHVVFAL